VITSLFTTATTRSRRIEALEAAGRIKETNMNTVNKAYTSKASLLKNLPMPLFAKEGFIFSLWQREVKRDFVINVFIINTNLSIVNFL
jgi:hypothetical protein